MLKETLSYFTWWWGNFSTDKRQVALPWWQTHGHGVKLSSLVTATRYAHQRNGVYCECRSSVRILKRSKEIRIRSACGLSVSNITAAVCCLCHALVVLLLFIFNVLFNHDLFTMFSDNEAFLCIQNINNLTAQLKSF